MNITLPSEKHDYSKFWSICFKFDLYVYQPNKFFWIANWQQGHLVFNCRGYTEKVTDHNIDLNYPFLIVIWYRISWKLRHNNGIEN